MTQIRLCECTVWSESLLVTHAINNDIEEPSVSSITVLVKTYTNLSDKMAYEPAHDKTYKMVCAPSEDFDQPGHLSSLIRVFACTQWVAKDPSFLHVDSEDPDQIWRMPRLIWVFAGCTCNFIAFVMSWLIRFANSANCSWSLIRGLHFLPFHQVFCEM